MGAKSQLEQLTVDDQAAYTDRCRGGCGYGLRAVASDDLGVVPFVRVVDLVGRIEDLLHGFRDDHRIVDLLVVGQVAGQVAGPRRNRVPQGNHLTKYPRCHLARNRLQFAVEVGNILDRHGAQTLDLVDVDRMVAEEAVDYEDRSYPEEEMCYFA